MTTVDLNSKGDKARLPRDERRAILLNAALEVFTAAGYHSAAMDEIADRANVSKPVLYQHFPSKLDLYLAVLDLHIDSLVYEIQKAISSTISNDTGLPKDVAMLLGVGLIGYVQVAARHWLERDGKLSRQQAVELVENLMWRGISGFPLSSGN